MILFLYGRQYAELFKKLAGYLERNSSVIELCCGFGNFYISALKNRPVNYLGVDSNPVFVKSGVGNGFNIIERDINEFDFPQSDYYIMISSLYHFYPHPETVISKMLAASSKLVIISEPVKNLLNSRFKLVSKLSLASTNEGKAKNSFRFTEASLDNLMKINFKENIVEEFATNRDKIYILKPQANH